MGKKRIHELAKELNVSNKEIIEKAQTKGYEVKNHMSALDETQEKTLRALFAPKPATPAKPAADKTKTADGKIKISKNAIRRRPETTAKPTRKPQQTQGNTNARRDNNRPQRQNQDNRRPNHNNGQQRPNNANSQSQNSAKPMSLQEQMAQASARRQKTQERIQQQKQQRIADEKQANQKAKRPVKRDQANKPGNPTKPTNKPATRPAAKPANKPATPVTAEQMQRKMQANQGNTTNTNNNNNSDKAANNRSKNFGPDRRRGQFNNQGQGQFKKKRKKTRKQQLAERNAAKKELPQRKERPLPELLIFTEGMNAQDLGKLLHREPSEIVKKLFMLGIMVNQNQSLDKDTIELLAADYGIDAQQKIEEDIADIDTFFEVDEEIDESVLANRPPVVTIMGHVDHGKTTLLDRLRHSHVTDGEAGGITQHIGAYQVELNDRLITFLDTPGHAAFTNMRARGADITDIIILVVAADDGVMPQTIEAINHAKAAKAPIIVAVNKIDKPGANPDHVMEQLMGHGLVPEDWGGDTIFVKISAKTGDNIDELLEMVLLEADVLELKANPTQKPIGTVIEAKLDKGKGPVASLLVQQGTLKIGDPIVVGNTFGRVRVMTNDRGRRVKEAKPSEPVEITGLNDVPQAADRFVVFEDEKTARAAGEERAKRALLKERSRSNPVTLDNLFETMKQGELKEVAVIIKADVQGSTEALAGSLRKIEVEGVRVNIIHEAVGAINESDITLAAASNAIIIGFNVRPTPQAKLQADAEEVDIRLHSVIYKAIDEIEAAMKGMLEPEFVEKITGQATVRETYKVSKIGTIAGCIVDQGVIQRDSGIRLIRDGIVIFEGKLSSLKRFKDDVKEVKKGFECGLTIENYNDLKTDDQIEAFIMQEVPVQ